MTCTPSGPITRVWWRFTARIHRRAGTLNGFSKKLAITFMHYNFWRKHTTLKMTPCMEAGVTDHEWSLEEVVTMVDGYFTGKLEAEFNRALDEKFTLLRTTPRSYAPRKQMELPWYLDMSRDSAPEGLDL